MADNNKTYTKNGNMRSPGYAQCIQWLSAIWADLDQQIITNSFLNCGIVDQNEDMYHSVLKKILNEQVIQNSIEENENEAFFNEYSEEESESEFGTDIEEDGDEENGDAEDGDGIDTEADVEDQMIENILEDEFEEEEEDEESVEEIDTTVISNINNNDDNIKSRLRKLNKN